MSLESDAFDEGRNYGWNEAVEQVRELRFENTDNPRTFQLLTDLLNGMLKEEEK